MNRTIAGLWSLFLLVVFGAGGSWASQTEVIEPVGGGVINWSQGIIIAKGSGAPPKEAKNIAQARLMAERAALTDARRNLLEVLKGVRVDSTTYVENQMVKNDEIRLQAEGWLQGSTEIRKMRRYLSDGAIEVTVAMNLSGDFLALMISMPQGLPITKPLVPPAPITLEKPGLPAIPEPTPKKLEVPPITEPKVQAEDKPIIKPEAPKSDPEPRPLLTDLPPYTGLVLDTRGLSMRPALVPKIVDEQGVELYQGRYVTPGKAAQNGLALYSKDLTAAQIHPRVGKNPLTVKGFKVKPGQPSDIILSPGEAKRVAPFTQKGTFLEECKVMIVID